ncbi:MAG: tRNA (guanosine(46)-N7)-methyltransferase TrmB [Pseudonocardia sp.]
MTGPTAESSRRISSFVHQRNRLTGGQQHAWERWWPLLGHDVADLVGDPAAYDPQSWFGRVAPLLLEIGPGTGESTAAQAAAAPEVDHLAVEVFEPGLARLLMRIDAAGLTNLRLLRGDAVDLLRVAVAPGALDGIRIFFPDPWPKRKHRKRRLVQPEFVALAASRLRPGGFLHLATDWDDYATQMRVVCAAEPLLENTATDRPGGWTPRPDRRPVTRFEERARVDGRDVRDLLYVRLPYSRTPTTTSPAPAQAGMFRPAPTWRPGPAAPHPGSEADRVPS